MKLLRRSKEEDTAVGATETLEEEKDATAITSQVINVVVLFPAAADSRSDDSNIENQPDELENAFDLVGEMDVEEELDIGEFVDIKLAQKESGALSK
ncbi:hypothetical protein T05_11675 [Trichinella murrelli]|uniref:Uncharacterized protein n=1 Tax=Trichinella murrelli TaxID=144512 RepID=A0A0V0T1T9_9BILA|nr:hypothetical protein T05_2865 [Trichinella murrelli]KRX33794.1 hypothetical protein T05_11675 [Trichinella murrelli]